MQLPPDTLLERQGGMSGKPHDRFTRALLTIRAQAVAHLKAFLPDAVVAAIDLRTLRPLPVSFIDEALRERVLDHAFRARMRGREGFLFVLYEHQRRPDALMAFRFLRAIVRLWEWWLEDHPGDTKLPPVIPLVLYNGKEPWSAPRRLSGLINAPTSLLEELAPWLPELSYVMTDLHRMSDEEITARAGPVSPGAALCMLALKHGDRQDLRSILPAWAELAAALAERAEWKVLSLLVSYLWMANPSTTVEDLRDFARETMTPEAENVVKTAWELAIQEGFDRGEKLGQARGEKLGQARGEKLGQARGEKLGQARGEKLGQARGEKLGQARGEVHGVRQALLLLLHARFGEISSSDRMRVEAADLTLLRRWFDRAVVAESVRATLDPS